MQGKVDECRAVMDMMEQTFKNFREENTAFRGEQSKMRSEIKDFESLVEEYR